MPNITQLRKTYPPHLSVSNLDILLSSALKKPKEFLCSHPEYPISIIQHLRFRRFIYHYKKGYSVAAITHHKEFFGLDFYVNRYTLIPRPETELMIEEVIRTLTTDCGLQTTAQTTEQSTVVRRPSTVDHIVLIDVGTGSGCIPIAIAKILKYSNIKIFATDISRGALRVARRNARTHNVSINFLHGNLLEPLCGRPLPWGEGRGVRGWLASLCRRASPHPFSLSPRERETKLVVITANLPYLTPEQFAAEPSIQREPRSALVGGRNGLELYEKLLTQIASLISNIKYPIFIFFEIDPSQSEKITALVKKYLPESSVAIKPDLAGRDRVVVIKN